VGKGRRGWRNE